MGGIMGNYWIRGVVNWWNSVSTVGIPESFVPALTITAATSILYFTFDRAIWRMLVDNFGSVSTPDLQGTWSPCEQTYRNSELETRRIDSEVPDPSLEIKQSWRHFQLAYLDRLGKYWYSDSTMIKSKSTTYPELICTLRSDPSYNPEGDSDAERGTLRLRQIFDNGEEILYGHLYTEPGRRETLRFERESRSKLSGLLPEAKYKLIATPDYKEKRENEEMDELSN